MVYSLPPTPVKALPGLICWQIIPIFMCGHLVSSGLDLDISETVRSKTVFIFPLHEKNHTYDSFRYYISRRIKTGELSGWRCLAFELDTRSFVFTIIATIRASSSNAAWTDFIDLSGIKFKKDFCPQQTLNIELFFVFLLIRVKFSTEKDAVLFALKVSLFLWKHAINICFDFIARQEKWRCQFSAYVISAGVGWILPLPYRHFKSIIISQKHNWDKCKCFHRNLLLRAIQNINGLMRF